MAGKTPEDEASPAPGRQSGGCVVLSPPGSPLLGVLLPALTRRWESMAVVSDEPAVMEQLAEGGVSMVVVVEPDAWGHLKPLAYAMGRYFGRVLCMKFEVEHGSREPRITSLASRWMLPGRPSEPGRGPTVDARGGDAASLGGGGPDASAADRVDDMLGRRLDAGADRAAVCAELDVDEALIRPRRKVQGLAVPAPASAAPPSGPPESLVTEEELAMLLGPRPGSLG